MSNVINQNHIPLCAPILGLASEGHEKCQTVTQGLYASDSELVQKKSLYKIEEGPIRQGDGEYIAFHVRGQTTEAPTKETFERVYQVFNTYAPHAILHRETPSNAMAQCLNRYELIRTKAKEVDPTLEIAFIPRTLYELFLLKKLAKEDLNNPMQCPISGSRRMAELSQPNVSEKEYRRFITQKSAKRAKKKCWHLCRFQYIGDNNHPGVREIAYRLNRSMIKHFAPSSNGFTYPELAKLAEKEIAFYLYFQQAAQKLAEQQKGQFINHCFMGYVFKMASKTFHPINTSIKPSNAQIIRQALALNCCRAAVNHFFLYRGSRFQEDDYYKQGWQKRDRLHNLSYGSSLLAGCVDDVAATSFFFGLGGGRDLHVTAIPYDQYHIAPFYIPPTNTTAQLLASGEFFHGRGKLWKDANRSGVSGMAGQTVPLMLLSELSREEVLSSFKQYKANAIHLNHLACIQPKSNL